VIHELSGKDVAKVMTILGDHNFCTRTPRVRMGSMHCEQKCEQYDNCSGKSSTPEFRSVSHKWQPGSAFQAGLIPVNFSEIFASVAAPVLMRGKLREGVPRIRAFHSISRATRMSRTDVVLATA